MVILFYTVDGIIKIYYNNIKRVKFYIKNEVYAMNKVILYDKYYFTEYYHKYYRQGANGSPSPRHFIAYMKNGSADIKSERKTIHANEGDVFYIPKGMKYYSYWYGQPDIRFLSIGFDEFNINRFASFDLQRVEATETMVEKLLKIPLVSNDIDCRALSLFYDALSEIVPLLAPSPDLRDSDGADKIKSAIRKNPHAKMSEIASICSVSEPYIYSVFKRALGITPNQYRQAVLCDMASELLANTDLSVEDISSRLGFSSSSYFRKVLYKYTGRSPREIRRSSFN